jgi:hypothetical protein
VPVCLLLMAGRLETIKSLYAARTGQKLEHKEKVELKQQRETSAQTKSHV